MKISLIFIIILTTLLLAEGQNNVTVDLRVLTGNHVEFHFNSLDDFDSGKTLENYTMLEVDYSDTVSGGVPNPSGPGWELNVKSMSASIESTDSGETLPLNTVEMRVSYDGGPETKYTLSAIDQEIVTDLSNIVTNKTVTISYDIGKTNSIDIVSNERFIVELFFTLKTKD